MICNPCRQAADLRAAREDPNGKLAIYRAKKLHEECEHPKTCPCLHRVEKKVDNVRPGIV